MWEDWLRFLPKALSYSNTIYDQSFRPNRLSNWEVEKWYPHLRPRARRGHTKVIADDKGHLLPGVPRKTPWGHFKSTWQLPRRITRRIAKELSGEQTPRLDKTSWEKRSSHYPLIEQESSTPPLPPTNKEKLYVPLKKKIPIVDETVDSHQNKDYEYDNTNPVGHDRTPKVINTSERVREDIESYSKNCKINPEKKNLLETLMENVKNKEDKSDNESMRSDDRHSIKSKDSEKSKGSSKQSSARSRKSRSSSSSSKSKPQEADFVSAHYAKELAQNNLKHQPLPDVVEDKFYQSMQMQQVKHPGAALDTEPTASAVGQKMYMSPGPTQCSKLKVYRPKTAAPKKKKSIDDDRPKTCKTKDFQEIDLAICWDLSPPSLSDEPKRPVHIDGSNGSVAPGIFTMVKTPRGQEDSSSKKSSPDTTKRNRHKPKTAWPEPKEKNNPINPSAVMDIINHNSDKITKSPTEHNPHNNNNNQLVEEKSNCSEENKNPNIPSPHNSSEFIKCSSGKGSNKGSNNNNSSINSEKLAKHKHYSSSPNLSKNGEKHSDKMYFSRPCMACETKTPLDFANRQTKSDYKMAFKAGVPNSRANSSNESHGSQGIKPLNVPKPKTPFARKSYSINTLAPPFSMWPGTTGMDYPEHWRLSSIYQQSFKPIEMRKNPMIKGVFR